MYKLKLRRVGKATGVALPGEVLDALAAKEGDSLTLTRADGGFLLRAYDAKFEAAMEAFERGKKKYHNAFRELAK